MPGEYKLTLEAVAQPGELVTTNNELSTFVNVLKGGLNVLYIEGALRVEAEVHPPRARFLARHQGRLRAARSPRSARAGPPISPIASSRASTTSTSSATSIRRPSSGDELADLAEVRQPRGGPDHARRLPDASGRAATATRRWPRCCRWAWTGSNGSSPTSRCATDLHWPGPLQMQPTPLGLMHFALMLAGNRQENAALWAKLPPLEGANKFHDLAPGAVVLAEAGPDKPLLVAHNFGDGRVMAFAGDSTWRWWMHGYESAHKRFWRQIVLWLARKDQAQEGNVWIRLAQRRFAPSQRVEFTVGATSPTGEPITDADYKAEIVLPDGTRRPLPLVRQERADGRLVPRHADRRRLRHRSHGHAERTSRWAPPGRGSSSSSRTWNSTTPRPTPPRWRAWPR